MTRAPITIDGNRVLSMQMDIPRVGVWSAVAQVDALEPVSGRVDLVVGGRTWKGTVTSGGDVADDVTVRVVGGAGRFGAVVPARFFANVPLRVPLADAFSAAGETLSTTSDPSLTSMVLPFWSTRQTTLGEALASMLSAVGGPAWRVLPDGSVWLGRETWPTFTPEGVTTLVGDDPVSQVRTYGLEDLSVLPGMTLDGYRISHVTIRATAEATQVDVWAEPVSETGFSRMLAALVALILRLVGPRLDYLARYPATVDEQVGDGLSVTPDDPRMPRMVGVPIRGLPGVKVTVHPGARCNVGFDRGDPSRFYATDFEPSALKDITITCDGKVTINSSDIQLGDGAGNDIARVGDAVMIQIPPPIGVPIMGQILSGSRNARA